MPPTVLLKKLMTRPDKQLLKFLQQKRYRCFLPLFQKPSLRCLLSRGKRFDARLGDRLAQAQKLGANDLYRADGAGGRMESRGAIHSVLHGFVIPACPKDGTARIPGQLPPNDAHHGRCYDGNRDCVRGAVRLGCEAAHVGQHKTGIQCALTPV